MQKLMSILLLSSCFYTVFPGEEAFKASCKLPYRDQLEKIICSDANKHFCEKVDLVQRLDHQREVAPIGIVTAVELGLASYEQILRKTHPGYSQKEIDMTREAANTTMFFMHKFEKENMLRKIIANSQCSLNGKQVHSNKVIESLVNTKLLEPEKN